MGGAVGGAGSSGECSELSEGTGASHDGTSSVKTSDVNISSQVVTATLLTHLASLI